MAAVLFTALAAPSIAGGGPARQPLSPEVAGRLAALALDCVHREYPNKIAHVLQSDEDARPPARADAGLLRLFRLALGGARPLAARPAGAAVFPTPPVPTRPAAALERSLDAEKIAGEVTLPRRRGERDAFERPYGLAWLLQLAAELREWNDPQRQAVGGDAAPAGARAGREPAGLAAQALPPDPRGRASPDRLRLRPDPGLGAHRRRRGDGRPARRADPRRSTSPTGTARWTTSPRGTTSSRPAWPRPTCCGGSWPRRSSRPGWARSCPGSPWTAPRTGWLPRWSPTPPTASWSTSTG